MRTLRKKKQKTRSSHLTLFAVGAVAAAAIPIAVLGIPSITEEKYQSPNAPSATDTIPETVDQRPRVSHVTVPDSVRGIYMTSCVAGTPGFRDSLVSLIEATELNSVIIDIKDYSGTISFPTANARLQGAWQNSRCGARDMKEFIEALHEKGIYVIGRITVFQDPYYSNLHPELAVVRESDGEVWKDYKGLSFIDVGARAYWDYIVELSKESYNIGFDELNFDYVRFPSDGNMKDIAFPHTSGTKAEQLEQFFAYLHERLSNPDLYADVRHESMDIPVLSVDIFGMTTTNTDDLNIGQVLERTLPYFDYVAPMVYPSHYPPGFNGWVNPNRYPYEVVHFSMARAVERARATTTRVEGLAYEKMYTEAVVTDPATQATTTNRVFTGWYQKPAYDPDILRPWLQDFDYGGDYDVEEVRAQIQAAYDAGLDSWMLWAPSNVYTRGALESSPGTR